MHNHEYRRLQFPVPLEMHMCISLKQVEKKLIEFLFFLQVTEDLYMKSLKWINTRKGQPAILLKRDLTEVNINNYNATLIKAWEANLDVQYVTNVYSCIMHVASYMSKPEKTLGDVLKGVSASTQHLGAKSSMKNIAKKFLTN